tara:strand:- start:2686 stop:3522 length:837 start_codon:yes stop_codon:yes gene_type:complete
MKKITLQLLAISSLLTFLMGCSEVSKQEYEALKSENEKLKLEIEELKFGPDKLLAQAKIYLDSLDYSKAKEELQILIDKNPASQQATEAKQLIILADNGIKEQKIAEEKAKIEKEKAEKERLNNATKKLRTKYDDIKEITWYYDKSTPRYTNYNSIHLYFGKGKYGPPWLRFRIQYAADNWLFIETFVIKTDNQSYTIASSYGEVERDNGNGGIWEWYDVPMSNKLYLMINDIVSSKSVKIRHNGQQYYKDRTITLREKQGLQNILDAYEALGGTTSF